MYIAVVILLGISLGSFINAYVWRVHQQSLPKKKRAASNKELSVVTGRSMCPNCKHTLAWYDLLPVVSWLFLRGKCRYCESNIGVQYPAVELLTAVAFTISYIFWPFQLSSVIQYVSFGLWLVGLVFLIALAVYDIKWMLLPNRMVLPLTIIAAIYASLGILLADRLLIALVNVAGAVAVASGIFWALYQISDGKWIGGGDVKLGVALGLFLGRVDLALLMLFISSLIGLIFAAPSVLSRSQRVFPYGPSLIIATLICVIWGASVINWYTTSVLMI